MIDIESWCIFMLLPTILICGSLFIPNSGVRTCDIFNGKYIYGSEEFCRASRNWWISDLMILVGIIIFIYGILMEMP